VIVPAAAQVDFMSIQLIVNVFLALMDAKHATLQQLVLLVIFHSFYKILLVSLDVDQDFINPDLHA
jgi:hypothetical protein